MKTHLVALLQGTSLDKLIWLIVFFFAQVVCMREECNSILSRPTEADKIGRFGRYRNIDETQISARYIGQADLWVWVYL